MRTTVQKYTFKADARFGSEQTSTSIALSNYGIQRPSIQFLNPNIKATHRMFTLPCMLSLYSNQGDNPVLRLAYA